MSLPVFPHLSHIICLVVASHHGNKAVSLRFQFSFVSWVMLSSIFLCIYLLFIYLNWDLLLFKTLASFLFSSLWTQYFGYKFLIGYDLWTFSVFIWVLFIFLVVSFSSPFSYYLPVYLYSVLLSFFIQRYIYFYCSCFLSLILALYLFKLFGHHGSIPIFLVNLIVRPINLN